MTDEADSLKDVLAQRRKKMSSLQAESRESNGAKRCRCSGFTVLSGWSVGTRQLMLSKDLLSKFEKA